MGGRAKREWGKKAKGKRRRPHGHVKVSSIVRQPEQQPQDSKPGLVDRILSYLGWRD